MCECICVCVGVTRSPGETDDTHVPSLFFSACPIFFGCIKPGNSPPRNIGDWLSREEVEERSMNLLFRERDVRKVWLARDTSNWKYFKGKGVESKIKYFRKYRKLLFLARLALTDCIANLPFLKPRQSTTKANKLAGSCKPKFLASASIIIPSPGRDETRARYYIYIYIYSLWIRTYVCT